jgi:heme/copper-type cytochrome/quinol oxidase subunit 3
MKTKIFLVVAIFVFMYLSVSFIALELNPAQWKIMQREPRRAILWAILSLLLLASVVIIKAEEEQEK